MPGKSGISNEAGRCQEVSSSFFASLNLFSSPSSTPVRSRRSALSLVGSFSVVDRCSVFTLLAQPRIPSSLRCGPPNISSILTDHDEVFELPGNPGRAGSLINRPVTSHHSRLQASPHRLHRFAAATISNFSGLGLLLVLAAVLRAPGLSIHGQIWSLLAGAAGGCALAIL